MTSHDQTPDSETDAERTARLVAQYGPVLAAFLEEAPKVGELDLAAQAAITKAREAVRMAVEAGWSLNEIREGACTMAIVQEVAPADLEAALAAAERKARWASPTMTVLPKAARVDPWGVEYDADGNRIQSKEKTCMYRVDNRDRYMNTDWASWEDTSQSKE